MEEIAPPGLAHEVAGQGKVFLLGKVAVVQELGRHLKGIALRGGLFLPEHAVIVGSALLRGQVVGNDQLLAGVLRHAEIVPVLAEQIGGEVLADINVPGIVRPLGLAVRLDVEVMPHGDDPVDEIVPGGLVKSGAGFLLHQNGLAVVGQHEGFFNLRNAVARVLGQYGQYSHQHGAGKTNQLLQHPFHSLKDCSLHYGTG